MTLTLLVDDRKNIRPVKNEPWYVAGSDLTAS